MGAVEAAVGARTHARERRQDHVLVADRKSVAEKTRLYLDTSVVSAYFDERTPNRLQYTRAFWTVVNTDEYELYTSEVTLLELVRTPSPERFLEMWQLISGYPSLLLTDRSRKLASAFLAENLVPPKKYEDAQHLALAVENGLHSLVSWNFKHMVNMRLQRRLPVVAAKNGFFRQLLLVTPQNFVQLPP